MTNYFTLQKFLNSQTHVSQSWHTEVKRKLTRRLQTDTRCQSQVYSWLTSSGADSVVRTDGVEKLLDETPICSINEDIFQIFFGSDFRSLEDIDFVVLRILAILMRNWKPRKQSSADFYTAKIVYNKDAAAAQELLSRLDKRGKL